MEKLKVINLFAGPGAGKSTNAALLFGTMKRKGYKVELVTEYAKDMVYEQRDNILEDQLYILAKQARRLHRLKNSGVEYIVTDSPILLSCIYNKSYSEIESLAKNIFEEYNNINYFIKRSKPYQQYGRQQTEDEAKEIDNKVLTLLNNYKYTVIESYKDILLNV